MNAQNSGGLVCLFGSGISIPAGLPSVADISAKILPPREFYRHTWNVYTFEWDNQILFDFQQDKRDAIIKVVEAARDLTVLGYRRMDIPVDPLNYEDVMFTLEQLYRAESGGRDDPLLAVGRRFMSRRLGQLDPDVIIDHLNLLADTQKCMIDLVVEMLSRQPGQTTHLKFLSQAINAIGVDNVVVVTTNQDLVLERFLIAAEIAYSDGFVGPIRGAKLWKPDESFYKTRLLKLLKIHGSINWYDIMPPVDYRFNGEIAYAYEPGCNLDHYEHPDGQLWHTRLSHPEILVGTFNKAESYTSGLYAELFCQWRSALMSTRNLLVCGYGFRDNGINSLLFNWAYQNRDRRLILVNPSFERLLSNVKHGVGRCLKEWRENRVLIPIETGVENLTWSAVESEMIS